MDFLYLSSPPWFPALLLLLPCLISFLLFMKNMKKQPNLPPGPPRLPIIGNLHQLGKLPYRSLSKLSKDYGPIMLLKLGQVPTLVVSSPEMAKQVLKTHDLDCCSRPFSHGPNRLSYNFLDIAFVPYNNYWRDIRKLCVVELFSPNRVNFFAPIRAEEIAKLINSLSLDSPKPVDIGEKIFRLSRNIICKIAFGKSFEGKQFESGKFQDTINEAMAMLSGYWGRDFFPYFGWIIDVFTGRHWRLEKCFNDFDVFYEKVLEEHMDPNRPQPEQEDIIDIMLRLTKDENPSFGLTLTKDHIKAVLMNISVGGIDTGSNTLVWAMTELARNPRVMKKVLAEIRTFIGRKPKVDENELENLKYLRMVVKETFRLHPPSPLLIPRECTRHCQIASYDLFPKTRILVNVWAMGRDNETWENPDVFYPERFEKREIDFRGHNFELLPFGGGRRICPALTIGAIVVESTLANLLHCFDWEMPIGMEREDISVEEEAGLTVHKKLRLYLVPVIYDWEQYEG